VELDVGGFLGIGEKPVAVGFDALSVRTNENGDLFEGECDDGTAGESSDLQSLRGSIGFGIATKPRRLHGGGD
jgi:hypothetical protein